MVKYSLGQHLGNQLISVTADRLRQIVKSPNILARMRGDEFIILLDHLDHPEDIQPIAQAIQHSF